MGSEVMDEQILSEFSKDFTESLQEYCKVPAPEQAFISGLEQRLLKHQADLLRPQPVSAFPRSSRVVFSSFLFTRRNWRYTVILLLAVLTIALFIIGPQQVLAQVQRWLGYVPGIGFVDLAETRVLANPAELTREGVTLRVEQAIAGRERTEIVISSSGFSEANLPWPNEAMEHPDFTALLLLPDGSHVETTSWELNLGTAKLQFPALPTGINQVTLIMPRLPLVPSGALPEDWEVPLTLRSATNELSEELFPKPFSPPDASDSHRGITLRVLDVAQTSSETAIRYQVEWTDPSWEFRFGLGTGSMPELRDNLGHIYWESPQSHGSSIAVIAIPSSGTTPTPITPTQTDTLIFPALSLSAGQASLWVDSIEFSMPAEETFSLDLGAAPKIGDSWPMDLQLEVAGFPVHLTEIRLEEETVDLGDGKNEQHPVLSFSLDPWEERDGFRLLNFDLTNSELGIYGSGGQLFSSGTEVYKGRLEFTAGKIPTGIIRFQVMHASVLAQGPWEVTWDIPGKNAAQVVRPAHLFPKVPERFGSEIQPVVEEVFLSDRLTAVKVGGAGLPADTTFVQALAYDPSRAKRDLYLEDNWGRRYELWQNEAFIRPDGTDSAYDPRWQFFPPLQPLAQTFSLHIPAIEVFMPANTSFEVEVPSDINFKKEEYEVTAFGGGGPERQETQTRWVSDPWPVDINLELAGYELQFTEAQVQHEMNSEAPYLLFLKGKPTTANQGNLHLNELQFSKVELPDGTTIQIDDGDLISYPYGGVGPVERYSNQLQTMIVLDVTNGQGDLLSGSYRVEISGVTSWISGPWELPLSLSGK
jgi:hypothetical protein